MAAAGFFTRAELALAPATPRLPRCGECRLDRGCQSPKMPRHGEGRRKILIVGEAPGRDEDREGRPFVGESGRELRKVLDSLGVDLDRDCWVTNAARCRPPNNELPQKAVAHCRPLVVRDVEETRPRVVIPLGGAAVASVVGHLWREDPGPVSRWVGWRIPVPRWNCRVCPTYHPSYVLRERSEKKYTVVPDEFRRHLKAAVGVKSRPFKDVPDYGGRVNCFFDPDEAAELLLEEWCDPTSSPVAFDFETTTLKPDGPDAEIVCCAVSDGNTTLAFPWHGEAVEAMKELLENPEVKKIGYNCKFEERWCRRYGVRVRGWAWDGMLAAHALDARTGVTGLKFQAFVRLGADDYAAAVAPYLSADGGNAKNRVREVGLPKLLKYCGQDALLEWLVAHDQARELGVEL